MNWYIKVLRNYFNFNGRARRKEYWFFVLFNVIFAVVAIIIDNLLGIASDESGYGPIYGLYALATLIPGIAVSIRRLHDIGKSGWYFLLAFIPCVGGIILLVFALTPGDTYDNEFGPDPKADEANVLGIAVNF